VEVEERNNRTKENGFFISNCSEKKNADRLAKVWTPEKIHVTSNLIKIKKPNSNNSIYVKL